jgi:hypothetical protein
MTKESKPVLPRGWWLEKKGDKKTAAQAKKGLPGLIRSEPEDDWEDAPAPEGLEEAEQDIFGSMWPSDELLLGGMIAAAISLTEAYAELVKATSPLTAFQMYVEEIVPLLPVTKMTNEMTLVAKCLLWLRMNRKQEPTMNELVEEIANAKMSSDKEDARRSFNRVKPELVKLGIIPKEWE